jgi:hypothetical protein
VIFRLEGGVYSFAAGYSIVPAYLEIERRTPISPGPGTLIGRAAMSRQVVRIDDAWPHCIRGGQGTLLSREPQLSAGVTVPSADKCAATAAGIDRR